MIIVRIYIYNMICVWNYILKKHKKKDKLRRDFIVGLTEQMPSFFVLVAMSLGWPLEYLCCAARNVNEQVSQYIYNT
jgi:hypothetical protein